jgi:hypothetical protein
MRKKLPIIILILALLLSAFTPAAFAFSISEKSTEAPPLSFCSFDVPPEGAGNVMNQLTHAQQGNVTTLGNVIKNNLKSTDFSGALRDLQGNPVPKPGGGFWDHKTEMVQSYKALQGVQRGLQGSLNNPNLDPAVRTFLQDELNKANSYIDMIDDLFRPFGGVR